MAFRKTRIASALPLILAVATSARAQIRASERATVSQTVDGTVITVDYARPQVAGRAKIFGGVVHVGEIWTPGANWATTIQFSRNVRLNGHEVPAGAYSVWIVTALAEWTFNLHKNPRLFHSQRPKLDQMLLSLPVKPGQGEHVEVLTFDFPRVGQDGATLRMRWGTTVVSLEILIQPSRSPSVVMTEAEIAPYLGSYLLVFYGERGPFPERRLELVNAKGALNGVVDGPEPWVMQFIPTGQLHEFLPAFLKDGKVFDVEADSPVLFEMKAGRAIGFRARGMSTEVWMRARRKS
ncbi:MAG: DUF2911 domain-containing protein [Gemmatimonadaceae bacterium]